MYGKTVNDEGTVIWAVPSLDASFIIVFQMFNY